MHHLPSNQLHHLGGLVVVFGTSTIGDQLKLSMNLRVKLHNCCLPDCSVEGSTLYTRARVSSFELK